jgi:uncharacterized LabA/DUF88 family protein
MKCKNNYAFIDSQNLNLGIKKMGWQLDYRKFRTYLAEKYGVSKAYMFIGFVAWNKKLYDRLLSAGFILVFKTVSIDVGGEIKGNVDADLVLKAALELSEYNKAVIVSSDGDFCSLVEYLMGSDKLLTVLSPSKERCSYLLRRSAQTRIAFLSDLRQRLEYKQEEGTS